MAFNIFVTNTVAYANHMMDNFYYLQGDRLPYGGNSLTATDNTYNLGSDAYRWDDVFCSTLYITNDIVTASQTLWILESQVQVTAAASRIEFTGLNGDTAEIYKVITRTYYATPTVTLYKCHPNALSGASDFNYYGYYANSTTCGGWGWTDNGITVGYIETNTTAVTFCEMILFAEAGYERMATTNVGQGITGTYCHQLVCYGHRINTGTASTITSMVFTDSANSGTGFGIGSTIEIYKRA